MGEGGEGKVRELQLDPFKPFWEGGNRSLGGKDIDSAIFLFRERKPPFIKSPSLPLPPTQPKFKSFLKRLNVAVGR